MNLRPHHIPQEVFTALAAGSGGDHAVRLLATVQYSKHLLLIRGVVERADAVGHEAAGDARQAYDLLSILQDDAPEAVDETLCHPSVGAWAQSTLRALTRTPGAADPGRLWAVTAAAAIRAGVRCSVTVTAVDGTIMLPSLGQVVLPPHRTSDRVVVLCTGHGAEVIGWGGCVRVPPDPYLDGPGWRGLRRLSARTDGKELHLLIDDLDPYRMPVMDNVTARLTDEEVRAWRAAFTPAWEILVRHHCTTADEVSSALRVLTPLESPAEGQVSATARDAFGCAAMSTPPDALTFAVTLAHEVQHAKLTALLDVVTLTKPDDGARYYAPWRDDPRPASGLLHGAYAYLGVAGFWRRQRVCERGRAADRAHAQFARWRAASHLVVDTLAASGRLTPIGEEFASGMRRTLLAWGHEQVPAAARARAGRDAGRHWARWRLRNGEPRIPY